MLAILEDYRNWLETLNYSKPIRKNNPKYVKAFFDWSRLESLDTINGQKLQTWFDHLAERKHQKREGSISLHYVKAHRNALAQFAKFLRETGRPSFEVNASIKGKENSEKTVLSKVEVQKLYTAADQVLDPAIESKGILAARERAILGLFYGCGLRKNEGLHITTADIDLKKSLLHVRKGKGYKERLVPIPQKVKNDFMFYLECSRPQLIRKQRHDSFLTGWYGSPLKGSALFARVQLLAEMAQINKPVGLHTLRHSIATHLLQSGMKLEQIARFLGHGSLESTQIYTHVQL